ncbi:unnamed protein product [Rhizoctonia solani]|uniref:Peptidase C14 caspase domain-containing protein n=1 Tax=Rhizoctonia solani TaxID=456999 RepID=A0A8H3DPH7_9AGAM|nr:unnamed protein product [Rhizoctonia solani]
MPRARGMVAPSVHAAPPLSRDIIRELQSAMGRGDRLPNTHASHTIPTKRRALLYHIDGRVGALPSTPNDIWKIYQMLRKRGYEEQNIRILSEGFIEDEWSSPTKQNIKASLEWLVQGASPGDYRYFHFSGHGEVLETTREEGKEARIVRNGNLYDTEIVPLNLLHLNREGTDSCKSTKGVKLETQTVPSDEIKYYNEAILTLAKSPPLLERFTRTWEYLNDYNRIRDKV